MKRCSNSLTTRETKIKMRYHFYNHQIGNIIKLDDAKCWGVCGVITTSATEPNPYGTADGNRDGRATQSYFITLTIGIPYNPTIGYIFHRHSHTGL